MTADAFSPTIQIFNGVSYVCHDFATVESGAQQIKAELLSKGVESYVSLAPLGYLVWIPVDMRDMSGCIDRIQKSVS